MSDRVLYVSAVKGGVIGMRPWTEAIRSIARRLADLDDGYSAPLALRVMFHIPGEVFRPGYQGMRSGSFSRRESHLEMQIAVPDGVVNPEGFMIEQLRLIDAAEKFAHMEGLLDTDFSDTRELAVRL